MAKREKARRLTAQERAWLAWARPIVLAELTPTRTESPTKGVTYPPWFNVVDGSKPHKVEDQFKALAAACGVKVSKVVRMEDGGGFVANVREQLAKRKPSKRPHRATDEYRAAAVRAGAKPGSLVSSVAYTAKKRRKR